MVDDTRNTRASYTGKGLNSGFINSQEELSLTAGFRF